MVFLLVTAALCLGSLPFALAPAPAAGGAAADASPVPRYNAGTPAEARLSPAWWPADDDERQRLSALGRERTRPWLGTDLLGRSVLLRLLAGGGVSLGIGLAAAALSVGIGTLYGAVAAYAGGAVDGFMMRVVDVLYGLPYVLLVVLIAVASDALVDEYIARSRERESWVKARMAQVAPPASEAPSASQAPSAGEAPSAAETPSPESALAALRAEALERFPSRRRLLGLDLAGPGRTALDVAALLLAIGGVSWLTMARVIRGQVLSLKARPFVEAARAAGVGPVRIFARHLLPNLIGPIVVYATLTVPQAILQESFLSFLGIGVKPPLPSWGNMAADALPEVNTFRSHWWLLAAPCTALGLKLLALNFAGESLREAFDPRARPR